MNINRIFDNATPGEFSSDGERRLSKNYKKDNGDHFIVVKAIETPAATLIILYGFPVSFGADQNNKIDHDVISKYIMHVFDLSRDELLQFNMPDYTVLMSYVIEGLEEMDESGS